MRIRFSPLILFSFWCVVIPSVNAQQKHVVQIKVFDQQLRPLGNTSISINDREYVPVGKNGSGYVELADADLPPKTIAIQNNELEAASWNYSKGVIEIIVRKKSYKILQFLVKNQHNAPLAQTDITFKGNPNVTIRTDLNGKFEIPVAIQEKNITSDRFLIDNYSITSVTTTETGGVIMVELIPIANEQPDPVGKPPASNPEYFNDFDLSKLDSIQSLTVFYAIFKNYHVRNLDDAVKARLDAKLKSLVEGLADSAAKNDEPTFIGRISDSSFVSDDVKNLLAQATLESQALQQNKGNFDEKIQVIREKLAAGVGNLTPAMRKILLSDLEQLQQILEENEGQFYKNQNHYRSILGALTEKYFDMELLETRLSISEAQRLQEQQIFRQRLLTILAVVAVIVAVLLFLIYIRNKLKAQKKELERANGEIKRINENLENLVSQRTKSLQEANRELDLFLYKASHDLRTPVSSIIGLGHLATLSLTNTESKDLFDKVLQSAHSMDRLLQKLRIISEINQPGEYSRIEILPIVQEMEQSFSTSLRRVNLVINCADDVIFYSNKTLTEAILFYLLENAIFFSTAKDQPRAVVDFCARMDNNVVEFRLRDNGIGIDEKILPNIFDMFYVGHEGSRGNGLGLYIVDKAVQALKGTITTESEVNTYTQFVVKIPVALSMAEAIESQPDTVGAADKQNDPFT